MADTDVVGTTDTVSDDTVPSNAVPTNAVPTNAVRFRVEQLAAAASVSVDTIRYYQKQGLLDPPVKEGRIGWYGPTHLERLAAIRDLADRGFTLAQMIELFGAASDPLLGSLAATRPSAPRLDRAELASASGLDGSLVDLIIDAGLLAPAADGETEFFDADAVEMLAAAASLIEAGLPLDRLSALAVRHAEHVETLAADAVELFHGAADGVDRAEVGAAVADLVPAVTKMVAAHFEATLVRIAVERVEQA